MNSAMNGYNMGSEIIPTIVVENDHNNPIQITNAQHTRMVRNKENALLRRQACTHEQQTLIPKQQQTMVCNRNQALHCKEHSVSGSTINVEDRLHIMHNKHEALCRKEISSILREMQELEGKNERMLLNDLELLALLPPIPIVGDDDHKNPTQITSAQRARMVMNREDALIRRQARAHEQQTLIAEQQQRMFRNSRHCTKHDEIYMSGSTITAEDRLCIVHNKREALRCREILSILREVQDLEGTNERMILTDIELLGLLAPTLKIQRNCW